MLKSVFKVFCTIFKVFAWIIIIGCAWTKPK